MIAFLNDLNSALVFYLLRHIALIILLLIIVDFFWKKQKFSFSYAVIRYSLLVKWGLGLFLIPFNWTDLTTFTNRATGPYWAIYWIMLIGAFALPLLLLQKKIGRNKWILLTVGFLSTIGAFFEIFVILITSIHQDFHTGQSISPYLSQLFLRPIIMCSFLVGFDTIMQKNRNDNQDRKMEDIIDGDVL